MKARLLPGEEWSTKLHETQLPELLCYVSPKDAGIVVVEEGDRVIASLGVLRAPHFEGLWVAPEYRGNPGVMRALLKAGADEARKANEKWAMAFAAEEHMREFLSRLGHRVPVDSYMVRLDGRY